METVIEKELKSYFFTVRGYIFIGVFLLISGFFFASYNVMGANADVGVMLDNTVVSFVLIIPVLTMGLFAGEKKNGTEKLLFSVPLKKWEIVLGKYLAAVGVFAIAVVINSLSSWVMVFLKGQTFGEIVTVYTGFLLLGAVFIAVGVFVSALTDNQIVAAVISLCACFLLYLSDWILDVSSNSILHLLALTSFYSNFLAGIFDVKACIYLLSLSAVFIFLTVVYIERVEVKKEGKIYILITTICVAASFLLFNYCVGKISNKVKMTFDMSKNGIFELSEETENYLESLKDDIDIYYLTEAGRESPYTAEVLGRYNRKNSKIHISNVDIIKNPSFTTKYTSNGEVINKGSVIVESSKRFTVVDPGSAFFINRDENGKVSRELGFSLETKLTGAIDYVLQDKAHTALCLTGHGEIRFAAPASVLKSENILVEYAETFDEYKGDADTVIIFGPVKDISDREYESICSYLSKGGKLFAAIDPGYEHENLNKIMHNYGLEINDDALTVDDMSEIIQNNRLYLMTYPAQNDITGDLAGTRNLIFPVSSSLNLTGQEGCNITKLAVTDKKTASRVLNEDSLGDKLGTGEFTVAAISENTRSKSAVFAAASTQFIVPQDDSLGDILSAYNYCNKEFFIKNIKYLMNYRDNIVIAPKSIMSRSLNIALGGQIVLILVFCILIPLMAFVAAYVVYKRRHNR
ncbi:MAG: Gldg family protein [Clostridiales bacterium]|nr:Gldg family protein [Clostridiales bacterium]